MTIQAKIKGSFVTLDCEGILTEKDLDTLFDAFEKARQKGPFVVITDTTRMKSAPRQVLGAFSDRLKKLPALTDAWLGDAVVIASPAVRFIVSTLLVLAPMPTEVKVFELRPEAQRWCEDILRQKTVSPVLRAG